MGYPPIEQPYYYPPQFDPNDPLVTPPDGGVAGWVSRISATFKRSWRSVISIIFVAQIVPALLLFLVIGGIVAVVLIRDPDVLNRLFGAGAFDASEPERERLIAFAVALVVLGLAGVALGAWLQAVTASASVWAIVREAATGQRVPLGAALRFGVRRSFAVWGWTLLGALLLLLGLLACFLPGLYVAFGLMMLTPVVLFERQGIGASFRALHRNALLIGVRAVIIWGVGQAVGSVVGTILQIPMAGMMNAPDSFYLVVYLMAVVPVQVAVFVPLYAFQIIANLLTYAEQRAVAAPLTTARLAADLD